MSDASSEPYQNSKSSSKSKMELIAKRTGSIFPLWPISDTVLNLNYNSNSLISKHQKQPFTDVLQNRRS